MESRSISVVTPTFRRPAEVKGLLDNISKQSVLPIEVVLVDGAPAGEDATEKAVRSIMGEYAFDVKHIRRNGGTAIQRNHGINEAKGRFIAFIDDDVRLDKDFFKDVLEVMLNDADREIGGVVGYRTNEYFSPEDSERWKWYKRLHLLTTFEPGRYDFASGYPINNSMQPPFSGTRPVDFMTTACALWRREVFDSGLRFDEFFRDYGVLEDAHLSLHAARKWRLLQCGDAVCEELRSPHGREDQRRVGYKSVTNYYYVFRDVAGPLNFRQKYRFWRFQAFELFRIGMSAIRRQQWGDVQELKGRLEGILIVLFGKLDHHNEG
jgi:glycosyltransferase involved in cell wall biosynthesis